LGFHSLFVGDRSAKENRHERAVETWDIGNAISYTEGGHGNDSSNAMAAHGVDQLTRNVSFKSGFEKGSARTDGIDDGVLPDDGGFKKLRITRIAMQNTRALHGLRRLMMHNRGYNMAKFAGLLDKSATGLSIGTDDK
jgi:hypothetical protein